MLFRSRAFDSELKAAKLHVRVNQATYFLLSVMLLSIFYVGTTHTIFADWSLGGVIAYYFYAYTMMMAFVSVGKIYLAFQNIAGPLDRVLELLEEREPVSRIQHVLQSSDVEGRIEFRDVSLSYNSEKIVLQDLSFEVSSGSWLLITGPSGSGKSTIANLIMGFHEPQRGLVLIDRMPVPRCDLSSLRRRIGYVGQDPFLFHGTLSENIAFSQDELGEERLQELVQLCCLDELVSDLPNGLQTLIG